MAWPNTPLTSYVSNTTPAIKAFDMNALQSGVNGIINATYSLKSVVVDGTGGSVVVPVAGTLKLSGTGSGTVEPTTSVAAGLAYREQVVYGWCKVQYDGVTGVKTFQRGVNVESVTRTAVGQYTVLFATAVTGAATACIQITPEFTIGAATQFGVPVIVSVASSGGKVEVVFQMKDTNFITNIDSSFHVVAYAY